MMKCNSIIAQTISSVEQKIMKKLPLFCKDSGSFFMYRLKNDIFLVAVQIALDVVEYDLGAGNHRLSRSKGNVWSNDGVFAVQKWMIGGKRRLFFKDVDACTGEVAAV